jgi:hypothetical protein
VVVPPAEVVVVVVVVGPHVVLVQHALYGELVAQIVCVVSPSVEPQKLGSTQVQVMGTQPVQVSVHLALAALHVQVHNPLQGAAVVVLRFPPELGEQEDGRVRASSNTH